MGGEFTLDESGLAPLAELHSQVASGLAQLTGAGGPQTADVARSLGTIAFAVNTALDGVTQSRSSTLQTTRGASDTIAELLSTAEKLYAQGDQEGAAKLRAAAETLEGSGATGGAGAGGTGAGPAGGAAGPGTPGGGGSEMAGQLASQIGQQVGQIAQGVAQSVQGLAQGLTQLPQQLMQGMQGMSGSDAKHSDGKHSDAEESTKAEEEKSDDREDRRRDEAEAADKRAEGERERHGPPVRSEGAQPGRSTDGGVAPVTPAPAPPQPAQTRPQ